MLYTKAINKNKMNYYLILSSSGQEEKTADASMICIRLLNSATAVKCVRESERVRGSERERERESERQRERKRE